jgi:hypothetical protein
LAALQLFSGVDRRMKPDFKSHQAGYSDDADIVFIGHQSGSE